ncbi:hypothetical protein [Myxococcus sp. NMCA1]|uniref:hypothetical protein n=1 Tax=Myxococcus sp. NMCA1 TaxID=2996785 RepID=UPI00228593EC|nr:hypothetical protein [Myxococcus sp. NMCA1]WAM25560.1 hypothetical protein OZ403_34375 [Myxococcus sp. NMCA1]
MDDEVWYGNFTYVREEWEESDSTSSEGCVTERIANSSKGVTIIDVTSGETGATLRLTRDDTSRSTHDYKYCSQCAEKTVTTSKYYVDESVPAYAYADIILDENKEAFISVVPDELIPYAYNRKTVQTGCNGTTETSQEISDDIYAEQWEAGSWTNGPTPGSYVVYGSRTGTGELGPGHYYRESVTWRFSNRPTVQLVIDAIDGATGTPFDSWRPKAMLWDGIGTEPTQAGATLRLEASIVPFPGTSTQPLPKATKITFKLLNSSTVPGTTMNSPLEGAQNSPRDLQFEQARNALPERVFVNMDTVHTPPGVHESATAILSSFDWGAYGEVTAEALLEDGSTLTARFRNSGEPMRIPKRNALSYVADSWKASRGVFDLEDSADDEAFTSGGDGHTGDGLTLYEEYRGFTANGTRVEADPLEVDFHVYNGFTSGAPTLREKVNEGIALFGNITGMNIHSYGSTDFLFSDNNEDNDPSKRIINFNALTAGNRHVTNQHLVPIYRSDTISSVTSNTHFGPSSPVNISRIEMAWGLEGDELRWSVAHELAHSANIPHHGDHGARLVYWELSVSGTVREKPTATSSDETLIEVRSEATGTIQTVAPMGYKFVSNPITDSQQGSLFGGDETCLMRQPFARAVHWASWPDRRYIFDSEPRGTSLCVDGVGKNFNTYRGFYSNGDQRQSRHGNAAPARGGCSHRICINDLHAHPIRNSP